MTQAPLASFTAQNYSPPTVTQFSVFLDNRVGKLLELLETFEQDPVCQVCAFTVQESSDYAVVRIITNHSATARQILRQHRLPFSEKQLLMVELQNTAGLTRMCLTLLSAELNIHFAYPVMLKPNGMPSVALSVDDLTLAGQLLRRKDFRLLGECDLPRPAG